MNELFNIEKIYKVEEIGESGHREQERYYKDYDKAEKIFYDRIKKYLKDSMILSGDISIVFKDDAGENELVLKDVLAAATLSKKIKGEDDTYPIELRIVEINVL